jgi:hypothetical protein
MRILITATSLIAGATASALTYSAVDAAGMATAATIRVGTTATATALGAGISLIAGPITGSIVATAIRTVGHDMLTPTIQTSSRTVAIAASTAMGALVIGAVSLLGMSLTYAWGHAITLLRRHQGAAIPVEARIIDDRALDCWVIEVPSSCPG